MADYTEEQLRDLLGLWERNSQGLSEAQMVALIDWDETPEATRSKIQSMVDARQTGTRPQRLSATEETYLQERGLGTEPEPGKPSPTKKLFGIFRRR
jgi:hypothetical protein